MAMHYMLFQLYFTILIKNQIDQIVGIIKWGVGVGVGYLNMHGNFRVTKHSRADYWDKKDVNVNGFGMAVGVFFEIAKGNHFITAQGFGPVVSDDNYKYQEENIEIMYRYRLAL